MAKSERKMSKEEIERRIEAIFGKGSGQEIGAATTKEKIVEKIEEMTKREQQFDQWEKMRQESKRRQREDRRFNLFWRRNKTSLPNSGLKMKLQTPRNARLLEEHQQQRSERGVEK